jgi:hypothetical protein
MERAALRSSNLSPDQKRQVVQLSAAGHGPDDIAMLLKFDVTEILYGGYTTKEVVIQTVGVVADGGLWYGLVKVLGGLGSGDDGDRTTINQNITGNNNNSNAQQGQTAQSDAQSQSNNNQELLAE